jgi:hypothetical protein
MQSFHRLLTICLGFALVLGSAQASAQTPVAGNVEPDIELAMAVRTPGGLCLQRMLTKYVVDRREETYNVTVKVPVSVTDPVTMKSTTQYRDQLETRTRVSLVPMPFQEQTREYYPWEDCHFMNREGGKLSTEDAQRRLAAPLPIICSKPGAGLPEKFRILFKPDTLCVSFAVGDGPKPAGGPVDVKGIDLPEGPIPRFRLLSIDAQGKWVFRSSSHMTVNSTFFQAKTELLRTTDGISVPTEVLVPVTAVEVQEITQTVAFPADAVQGETVAGAALAEKHRETLQQRELPVIVIDATQSVAKEWRALFQPQMLIMNIPFPRPEAPGPSRSITPEAVIPRPVPATTP